MCADRSTALATLPGHPRPVCRPLGTSRWAECPWTSGFRALARAPAQSLPQSLPDGHRSLPRLPLHTVRVPQPATVLDARPAAADFRASGTSIALPGVAIGTPGAFVLSTLSGLAYAAGFPPLSRPVAPWLALTPLLVACAAPSPGRAARGGLCWAVTAAVGVAGFLPTMLSGYFGLATLPSWLGSVAIVAIL